MLQYTRRRLVATGIGFTTIGTLAGYLSNLRLLLRCTGPSIERVEPGVEADGGERE